MSQHGKSNKYIVTGFIREDSEHTIFLNCDKLDRFNHVSTNLNEFKLETFDIVETMKNLNKMDIVYLTIVRI